MRKMGQNLLFHSFFEGILLTSAHSLRLSSIAEPLPGVLAEAAGTERARSGLPVNALLEQHVDMVYRYALRLVRDEHQACDLVQEVMLRGWRSRHKLRDPEAMQVWLLRIATNLYRDQLRTKHKTPRLLVDPPPDRQPSAERRLIGQENVAQVLEAFDHLSTRQRQVIHLVTCEGLTQEQTAEVIGISTNAVKTSLSTARKRLREQLRELYEETCGKKCELSPCPPNPQSTKS